MPDRGCYMKLLLLIIKTFKPTLMCYCTLIILVRERLGQEHSIFENSLEGNKREREQRRREGEGREAEREGRRLTNLTFHMIICYNCS